MSEQKKPPPGTTDLVICARVADCPDPSTVYAGATAIQTPCNDCAAPVWYNPASVAIRATPTFTPTPHLICQPCSHAYGYRFVPISPRGRG